MNTQFTPVSLDQPKTREQWIKEAKEAGYEVAVLSEDFPLSSWEKNKKFKCLSMAIKAAAIPDELSGKECDQYFDLMGKLYKEEKEILSAI